ncbi:hypothetical protein Ahy_A01g001403 isoform B [Arachis hypogaea]|uniref:Uncharacterized protein n=1 Tax=Arachis hypogaea TaxID=3818 RepID=A0A445EN65_ARAHY|nr:hypothetical protein Ahy_A01g001403 isoform B [Arachis hypogaea]
MGLFTYRNGPLQYMGGETTVIEEIDGDRWSVFETYAELRQFGYVQENIPSLWFKDPTHEDLKKNLKLFKSDVDSIAMCNIAELRNVSENRFEPLCSKTLPFCVRVNPNSLCPSHNRTCLLPHPQFSFSTSLPLSSRVRESERHRERLNAITIRPAVSTVLPSAPSRCQLRRAVSSVNSIAQLLSRISYYFSNGPFLRFWIKKGYDTRKDPDSRMLKLRWEEICTFRAFPYKLQTSLQLFELVDDYIQSEINKPPSQASCTISFVNLY